MTEAFKCDSDGNIITKSPEGQVQSVMRFDYEGELLKTVTLSDGSDQIISIQEYEYERFE